MNSGSRLNVMGPILAFKNEVLSSGNTRFWNEDFELTATQLGPDPEFCPNWTAAQALNLMRDRQADTN